MPKSKQVLDAPVIYSAKDSMRINVKEKKLYLYGDAEVNYKEINLKSAYIELDFGKNTLFAEGVKDSLGREKGRPEFKEGEQVIKSKTILYNFETKKGLITDVITQEADGYIHGDSVKKMENDVMFIKHGKYTTCEDEHPHFYFNISKLKVIPDDKIISGPANLVLEDVPTPLAIPFGFFPNKKGRKNGILIPQYGESQALGFFLKEGGYYVGLSEHMDLALTGDIYTRGSWATRVHSNYTKRYKFSGSFDARYSQIQISERDFPDYELNKDFFIKWTHHQDQKARPNSSFSADVSAGTSSFNRLNSAASTDFLQNAFQSSINYNKSWAGKPYSLNISARHTQNTQDSSVVISLPEAAFVVQRIFPLKRKTVIGSERWYEKIGVSLTSSMKNEISTKEYLLFTPASLNNFRNGVQHTVPISTSFKTMKYFTITPSINITERWYFKTLEQSYDNELQRVISDTITRFARAGEYNLNTSFTTKIYGMYQYRKGPVEAIRHVITPTLGLTYRPDFDSRRFGYFGDSTGTLTS
ncbi:MAG: putative LPS assembly protein LptD, partial [Bacteroidia bacterium]